MDTFELLIQTGLTKKEAAVYTMLLESGPQTITGISKATHINRPALYQLLPKLQKDGLVSVLQKQKRTFYEAESPKRILAQYQDNHKEVASKLEDLVEMYQHHDSNRPVIKYFEGETGLRFVFDDVAHTLPAGSTFYRYTSHVGKARPYQNTYYQKARETKRLERLVIASEEKAERKTPKLERTVKYVPSEFDLFTDNISLVIYGDKTAYIDYSSKTTFIIESAKIAGFQEKLFKLLWSKLKYIDKKQK